MRFNNNLILFFSLLFLSFFTVGHSKSHNKNKGKPKQHTELNNDEHDKSPRERLSKAIEKGDLSKVKSLIESFAVDVDQLSDDYNKWSPLLEAASRAQPSIMRYLIEKGAFIEGLANYKKTVFTEFIKEAGGKLAFKNLLETTQFLLNSGADVNLPDDQGYTPLMYACKYTRGIKLIEFLVEKGALINAQAKDEYTALHLSLLNDNVEAFRYLLHHGGDLSAIHEGLTFLGVLASQNKLAMAKLLIEEANVDVNQYDRNGATALCWAAAAGNNSMIKFLVEQGGEINAQTISETIIQLKGTSLIHFEKNYISFSKGSTPLTFAKKWAKTPTIELISSLGGIEFEPPVIREWSSYWGL